MTNAMQYIEDHIPPTCKNEEEEENLKRRLGKVVIVRSKGCRGKHLCHILIYNRGENPHFIYRVVQLDLHWKHPLNMQARSLTNATHHIEDHFSAIHAEEGEREGEYLRKFRDCSTQRLKKVIIGIGGRGTHACAAAKKEVIIGIAHFEIHAVAFSSPTMEERRPRHKSQF